MNVMKQLIIMAAVVSLAGSVMAGPPHCRRGNDGLRLAAGIVHLVGTGLNILRLPVVIASPAADSCPQPAYGPPAYAIPQVIPAVPVRSAPPVVVAPVIQIYPWGQYMQYPQYPQSAAPPTVVPSVLPGYQVMPAYPARTCRQP